VRKNSGMWKTISRKEKLRRVLLIIFGAGVIALAGVSYQYVKNAVPDRINVVVDRAGASSLWAAVSGIAGK